MKTFGCRYLLLRLALSAGLVCCVTGRAAAQPNPNLPATYGAKTLQSGFLPDPLVVNVVAGGPIRTSLGGVNAWVANPPDFRVLYTAGKLPLTFHVNSGTDTTLLINLPDGTWIANDDGAGGLNPQIRLPQPQSGRYDIYVGTFNQGNGQATLYITELK